MLSTRRFSTILVVILVISAFLFHFSSQKVSQSLECPNNCTSEVNGVCDSTTGNCSCNESYFGEDCSLMNCPNNCSSHGICNHTTGICDCYGMFFEKDCSLIQCPNNCSGNGACNFTTGNCSCSEHYFGEDCGSIYCANSCSGNGACNFATGICTCRDPFFGKDCSLIPCPNNCTGNGICNFTTGSCSCNESYFGEDCSLIACPNNCSAHGICNHATGICDCYGTFFGKNCSLTLCPDNCSNNGICDTSTGKCVCHDRYTGANCSQRYCVDPTCNHAGKCNMEIGTCQCDGMHAGESCELLLCAKNCSYPHGICDFKTGLCNCNKDWSGAICSVNVHIAALEIIKSWNAALGTMWICIISIVLPFLPSSATWVQLLIGLIGSMQFIGLSELLGSSVPPLFLKFCAFFEWTNFIFELDVRRHQFKQENSNYATNVLTNLQNSDDNYLDLRQEMKTNGLIVFLDNFLLVCIVFILTLIFNGLIIVYKMMKSQQRFKNMESNLFRSLIQLSIIAYLGVTSSVMYEIQLAFRGGVVMITLLVAFALLIGYLIGMPAISAFALYKRKHDVYIRESTNGILDALYEPFKPEFYYFIIFIYAKQFLIGSFFGLFSGSPKDQCIGLFLILSAYLLVCIVTKPFISKTRTHFEIFMTSIHLITVVIVFLYSTGVFARESIKNFLCFIGIIVPHVALMAVTLVFIIYYILSRSNKISDMVPNRYRNSTNVSSDYEELINYANRSILEEDDEY